MTKDSNINYVSMLGKLESERRDYAADQLSKKFGFKPEYAASLWEGSRTKKFIDESKNEKFDNDDFWGKKINSEVVWMTAEGAEFELELEMINSEHWLSS